MTASPLGALGSDWFGVVIDRDDVESNDVGQTLGALSTLLADRETVRKFQGRVELGFHGYNADPRELYEVPEIRCFCSTLDAGFPYWFYFLSSDRLLSDTLFTITCCLTSVRKVRPGLVSIGPDFPAFMLDHFAAMNRLFERYSLDERENDEISRRLNSYFYDR